MKACNGFFKTKKMTTTTNSVAHAMLWAEPMPLYPTMGNTKDVLEFAKAQLPITNENDLTAILMRYHNTLISQVK